MAVVQTPFAMTLGQQNKIYNVIQHSPQQSIIVSGTLTQPTKTVIQSKRPLAPAPERTSVLVTNNSDLRCKRKIQFMPYGPQQQPASVARRNARERNRVKQVNNGFATLRQHIPASVAAAFAPQGPSTGRGASKKLSKVETLRLAVEYIRSLKQMIEDHENDSGNCTYSNSPDQYQNYPILLPTPTCSEASSSPTPSHSSESSFSAASSYTNTIYHQENFENYEPKSPEDEELLDAIFSWQQNE
ncbi:achaete-scute homolog 1a-like [Tribolium madens]|uniref:achaete-scute homolog 1a-like n=1 Tax=Tribolium madens TaxID=41895 RepID=UPI001CF7610C|nr:achaete-scute homolog 1a-like [Tribolium madens]